MECWQKHPRVLKNYIGWLTKMLQHPVTGFLEVGTYNLKVDASSLRSGSYIYKFETENLVVHLLK
jgi:hypothetical protein